MLTKEEAESSRDSVKIAPILEKGALISKGASIAEGGD